MMRAGIFTSIMVLLMSSNANAYIGPGLGAGVIGVVLGVLTSILLAVIAIIWYPIKRFFKLGKRKKTDADAENDGPINMGAE